MRVSLSPLWRVVLGEVFPHVESAHGIGGNSTGREPTQSQSKNRKAKRVCRLVPVRNLEVHLVWREAANRLQQPFWRSVDGEPGEGSGDNSSEGRAIPEGTAGSWDQEGKTREDVDRRAGLR